MAFIRPERVLIWLAGALCSFVAGALVVITLMWALLGAAPGEVLVCRAESSWSLLEVLSASLGFDFGPPCFGPSQTMAGLVLPALGRSILLVASATLLSTLTATMIVWVDRRPVRVAAFGLGIIPSFVLAYGVSTVLNASFASCLSQGTCPEWFPVQAHDSWLRFGLTVLCLGLGSGQVSGLSEDFRALAGHLMNQDWVLFSLSQGEPRSRLLVRLLAGPGSVSILHRSMRLFSETVVVEAVLGVQGIGLLIWEAARYRDGMVLAACTIALFAVLSVLRALQRQVAG